MLIRLASVVAQCLVLLHIGNTQAVANWLNIQNWWKYLHILCLRCLRTHICNNKRIFGNIALMWQVIDSVAKAYHTAVKKIHITRFHPGIRFHQMTFLGMVLVVGGGKVFRSSPDNVVLNPAIKRCRWATGLCSFLPFWSLSISAGCWTQDAIFGVSPAWGLLSAEMNCKRRPQGTRGLRAKFPTFQKFGLFSRVLFNGIYWSVVKETEDILILCCTENEVNGQGNDFLSESISGIVQWT